MTHVLIDTSMWIEFFSKRPSVSSETLSMLKETISNGSANAMVASLDQTLLKLARETKIKTSQDLS